MFSLVIRDAEIVNLEGRGSNPVGPATFLR